MSAILWLFGILVVAAVVMRMVRTPPVHPPADRDAIDRDELEDAEREVRNLDTLTAADDADDQLHDWGPGAPKH